MFAWGLDRFIKEARAIHRFRHPNVVRAHRYIEAHGTAYIVMEYVEGESLAALLEARGSLPVAAWRPWLDRLLDGLAHVHDKGYLHRDIKPGNVVIRAADGEPVLIDFGAARVLAAERTHTLVLAPAYAPIEQHSTKAQQGSFTDIYSLAAVSYRALTGEPPPNALDRMLDDRYEPLAVRVAGADQTWLAIVDRGLALQPQDRPETVEAWRKELQDVLTDALRAAARYPKAADQGDADAQFQLGRMYDSGKVLQDHAQAAAWYRKAAKQGHTVAQFNLGCLYMAGEGVPQEFAKAAAWYRKAADQGDADAQLQLGRMYGSGEGVPKDPVQAHVWFNIASTNAGESPLRQEIEDQRQAIEADMTPSEIADATRRAQAYMETNYRDGG